MRRRQYENVKTRCFAGAGAGRGGDRAVVSYRAAAHFVRELLRGVDEVHRHGGGVAHHIDQRHPQLGRGGHRQRNLNRPGSRHFARAVAPSLVSERSGASNGVEGPAPPYAYCEAIRSRCEANGGRKRGAASHLHAAKERKRAAAQLRLVLRDVSIQRVMRQARALRGWRDVLRPGYSPSDGQRCALPPPTGSTATAARGVAVPGSCRPEACPCARARSHGHHWMAAAPAVC